MREQVKVPDVAREGNELPTLVIEIRRDDDGEIVDTMHVTDPRAAIIESFNRVANKRGFTAVA